MYEEMTDRQADNRERERRGEKTLEGKEMGNSRLKRALALISFHDES